MELEELIKNAKKGDDSAFTILIKTFEKDMYRVAKAMLKNDEDALDCIQETIVKIYKSIRRLQKEEYFKTWLLRILINECIDLMKSKNKIVPYNEYAIESNDDFSIDTLAVKDAVDSLDYELRILVILYYFEDMSLRDIAESLKIPEGTIKSRLSRARSKLKEILDYKERGIV